LPENKRVEFLDDAKFVKRVRIRLKTKGIGKWKRENGNGVADANPSQLRAGRGGALKRAGGWATQVNIT
jgi:hypothetical protein